MKLNELTLTQAINGLKAKEFKVLHLVEACLHHIQKHDDSIKAFITVTTDLAIKKAHEADELILSHGAQIFERYPLLGIPYACKDNYCTKGIQTTASSKILDGFIPPYESTVSQKLNDAGAILLGKTNMDAFAHGSSTETSDYFTTKNPWDTSKVPGGSSGGSAAAVAANMCIFAMGSETGGSIRGPAAWCGVTGLKPSYGRLSRYGVIAMASSTDCPGPITKTIEDSSLLLQITAGQDVHDVTSSHAPVENFAENLKNYSLKGKKIGRPRSYFDIDLEAGTKQKVEESLETFKKLGAEIVDMDLLDPKYSIAVYTILQRSEVSSNLARFDGIRFGHPRTSFGFEAKKRIMLGTYALSSGYYDAFYSKAQKVRTLIVEDYAKAFEKVDLIAGPAMPCVALAVGESSKSSMFGELMDVLNEPSCISGNPGVTFPCGQDANGLPVGVQLIGAMNKESEILGAAHVFQKETNYHTKFPEVA